MYLIKILMLVAVPVPTEHCQNKNYKLLYIYIAHEQCFESCPFFCFQARERVPHCWGCYTKLINKTGSCFTNG